MSNQRMDNLDIAPITPRNSSSFQFSRDDQEIDRKNALARDLQDDLSLTCTKIKENGSMSVDEGVIKRENEITLLKNQKEKIKKTIDRTIKRCQTEAECKQQDICMKFIPLIPSVEDQQSNLGLRQNGSLTDRSSVLDYSMRKMNAINLDQNLEQQERMLKEIEEKALMLRKKQKKQRVMLKQFKKSKQVLPAVEDSRVSQGNSKMYMNTFSPEHKIKGHRRINSGDVVTPTIEIDFEHVRKYQYLQQKCHKYEENNAKFTFELEKQKKQNQKEKNIYQQKIGELNMRLREIVKQKQESKQKYEESLINLNHQINESEQRQQKFRVQIAKLEQQLINKQKQNGSKQEIIQQHIKTQQLQKQQNSNQQQQINKLNKCIDDLKQQKTLALQLHSKLIASIQAKSNQLIDASQFKMANLKQQIKKKDQECNQQLNKINSQLKQLRQHLKVAKQNVDEYRIKNIQLSKSLHKNANLFKEIIQSKTILNQKYQELHRTNSELSNQLKHNQTQKQQISMDFEAQLKKIKQNYDQVIISNKTKEKESFETKRHLEKTCAQLTQDKRKMEQLYLKEINSYKSQSLNSKKMQAEIVKLKQQIKNNDQKSKNDTDLLKKIINQSNIKVKYLQQSIKQDYEIIQKEESIKSYQCQKLQQTLSSQLTNSQLRQQIQSQLLTSKVIESQLQQKQMQLKIKDQQLAEALKKIRQDEISSQEELREVKEKLRKIVNQNNKITQENQQKTKNIRVLQECLKNAEEHIRKVQTKYQSVSKQLTEKNLATDFIWMQLQDKKGIIAMLQNRLAEQKASRVDKNSSHEYQCHTSQKSSEQQSPIKGQNNPHYIRNQMRRILSTSTIKQLQQEIKQIKELIESKSIQDGERGNQQSSLPLCLATSINSQADSVINSLVQSNIQQRQHCRESLEIMQISKKLDQLQKQKQEEIQQIQKKNVNIMLHHNLSDALSESQKNDEIIQMISNKNSNTSKMQSSLGAFSEYSRIKSTQSQVTHRQLQDAYKNKMKNTKLMAKLNKLKKK